MQKKETNNKTTERSCFDLHKIRWKKVDDEILKEKKKTELQISATMFMTKIAKLDTQL